MVSDSGPVVFDTSVVSILFRRDATDRRFSYFQEALAGRHGLISFQTLEELHYWRHAGGWGEARTLRLRDRIHQLEIIWPDSILAEASARLRADLKRAGRTLTAPDAWIAATALRRQCPLASADHDFRRIPGLRLIQPH